MNDRAARAELEAVQTRLRHAREQLTRPLDDVRREVGLEIDRLVREGPALRGTLERLRGEADAARLQLVSARTNRPATLGRRLGTSSLTLLSCGAVIGGAMVGVWLEARDFPQWVALVCCAAAALAVLFDLSGFVRWLKR